MIKFFTLKILQLFDLYYQKKLFKYLRKINYKNFEIFFDVGAHKGESINLFTNNFKIKKIYSFEPSSINYKILHENKKLYEKKFKDLEIFTENYALGRENKSLLIKQLEESSSSTINEINTKSNYFKRKSLFLNFFKKKHFYKELKIKQTTLSDYINNNKILRVDFLKIDTEGYEYDVLLGLKKNFSKISLIMFEHHYHDMLLKNYVFRDIHNLLISNNFKQIYKYKMPFRKTFEYVYEKKKELINSGEKEFYSPESPEGFKKKKH
jgi:FkbM family methyltransferase